MEGGLVPAKTIDLRLKKKASTWGLEGPIWEDNNSRLWLDMDRPFMQESVWQWRIGPHGSMERADCWPHTELFQEQE